MTDDQRRAEQVRAEFEGWAVTANYDVTRAPEPWTYSRVITTLAYKSWLAAAERYGSGEDALSEIASKLIDAWVVDKGKKIPWAKAVQIVAIVTKQSDAERDRLLRMGDEDGSCEMCGRSDAAIAREKEGK